MASRSVTPDRVEAPAPDHRAVRNLLDVTKWIVHQIAIVCVLPLWLAYRILILILPARRDQSFQTFSQALSLVPGVPGVIVRRAFYGLTLEHCPRNATIGFGTVFSTPEAEVGRFVYMGSFCNLGKVTIGDDVLLGSNVDILSGTNQHHIERLDVPIRHQGGTFRRVRVGRDVWIGNGAIVAADVGDQAVVAAGAVVVKPVPARAIVGGNPARPIGERGRQREPREPIDADGGAARPTPP
jgi:acetyltransferase-like isoleucine patch superfamily enzyme